MKLQPFTISLLQAAGLVLYVFLVANILQAGQQWFSLGHAVHPVLGATFFLMLFVFSAIISASIVLGYPVLLFFDGKRSLAVRIVFGTAAWLILFLAAGGLLIVL